MENTAITESAHWLFAIGIILLMGLVMDFVGRHSFLPRVTLLLAFGILVGNEGLGIMPNRLHDQFELIANIALLMIGFLLGGKLTYRSIASAGAQLLWISAGAAVFTTLVVTLLLLLAGASLELSILLGCIASATAPAATVDTVMESGIENRFSRLLLAVVALDDAWALLLFSFGLAAVSLLNGGEGTVVTLLAAGWEIGGAILLGIAIGLPAAFLSGRLRPGQPMLTEALGLVFLCGGSALFMDVSFMIAAITMGMVITNFAEHHEYAFHEIENVEWPFMMVFFVLAGASLDLGSLAQLGVVGVAYMVARIFGKIAGARLGGLVSHADQDVKQWMGLALLPQAGVAIGMALLVSHRYPQHQQTILSIVISTTVLFELFGPLCTRFALRRSVNSHPS